MVLPVWRPTSLGAGVCRWCVVWGWAAGGEWMPPAMPRPPANQRKKGNGGKAQVERTTAGRGVCEMQQKEPGRQVEGRRWR